jgi:hypothetical protein
MIDSLVRRAIIARLNDHFRITGKEGWHFLSAEVSALPVPVKAEIISAVRGIAPHDNKFYASSSDAPQ